MPTFPDLEVALLDVLAPLVPNTDHLGTDTPSNLDVMLPFLRLDRYGGPWDQVSDRADLDLDVFAATRQQARSLLVAALERLNTEHRSGSTVIDSVTVTVGPARRPWINTNIRRWSASLTVTARRQ